MLFLAADLGMVGRASYHLVCKCIVFRSLQNNAMLGQEQYPEQIGFPKIGPEFAASISTKQIIQQNQLTATIAAGQPRGS